MLQDSRWLGLRVVQRVSSSSRILRLNTVYLGRAWIGRASTLSCPSNVMLGGIAPSPWYQCDRKGWNQMNATQTNAEASIAVATRSASRGRRRGVITAETRKARANRGEIRISGQPGPTRRSRQNARQPLATRGSRRTRSEEHTSELQSRQYLVCRL